MYIWRQLVRVIKRAHANEPDAFTSTAHVVISPNRDFAFGASGNDLASATGRRNRNVLNLTRNQLHPISLKKGVQCKGRTGVFLTAAAVAAMYDQGLGSYLITHMAVCAATISCLGIVVHGVVYYQLFSIEIRCARITRPLKGTRRVSR